MVKNIAVINEENDIWNNIKNNLKNENYKWTVFCNIEQALQKIDKTVDLVIVDYQKVKNKYGWSRFKNNIFSRNNPLIILLIPAKEVRNILKFKEKVDDYLIKPCTSRELMAKIKLLSRENSKKNTTGNSNIEFKSKKAAEKDDIIKKGEIKLNTETREVTKKGETITLTPKEFKLLKHLIINFNKVLTRKVLLNRIWGIQYSGSNRTIDVHIRRLRGKIGQDYIQTIRGMGYKFVLPLTAQ